MFFRKCAWHLLVTYMSESLALPFKHNLIYSHIGSGIVPRNRTVKLQYTQVRLFTNNSITRVPSLGVNRDHRLELRSISLQVRQIWIYLNFFKSEKRRI